ncbi:YjdF family protein [Streptomyces sp. NBC_00859]|uniref:YjdF family protein n=1 Tax=Streptomyces sp. NBC_00859 TaxID=2903682 RepID=UPI003869191C|nr:YjdF family protein [Streptomyces sp. NBC_00859]
MSESGLVRPAFWPALEKTALSSVTFTLCFEAPFWVGILEIAEAGELRATRHLFGHEPTDAELYQFLLCHGQRLLERADADPAVPEESRRLARANPKRAMRLAAREAARVAEGQHSTASQEAIRLEGEQRVSQRAKESRKRKEKEAERKYAIARAKRKQRKRGH